jgi:hypothetical protein
MLRASGAQWASMPKDTLEFFAEFAPSAGERCPPVHSSGPDRDNSGRRERAHRPSIHGADCLRLCGSPHDFDSASRRGSLAYGRRHGAMRVGLVPVRSV